eukprot:CAMPEP_0202942366 /NCGR_PEP_ID=MMETSP1395-20130829/2542_1 /ASSEMBLY_ACC=CAM_ASM_000871 /TAXON_ID=5961 /ORGANISM="Blepharisma japonicum, Strain Stock R1072" /LENGTH=174 /DNA_ID=CAMNT_0049638523 /DNA_START=95 /DNA_END=620 /DNA_ORIENTATION=+
MASSGSSSPHSRHDSHSPSPHSPRRSRSPPRRVSLLVRNLVIFTQDPHTRSEDIRNHFSKYGEVRDVYIPRDYYTQRPRGFCFVEFNKYDDAKAALEKTDGTELQGSTVKIVFAREGRKGPDEMRRRDDGEEEGPALQGTGEDLEAALLQGIPEETDQSQVQGNSNIQVFESTF